MITKDPTFKKLEKISSEIKQTRAKYNELIHLSEKIKDAYQILDREYTERTK